MVKFNKPNKSGKKGKVTKHIRNLSKPESVKYNKPLPVIEKCYLPFRFKLTVFFISAFLLALVARAGYVQHVNSDFYSKEADKRSLRSEKVLSIRGSILDRNGVILSSSVPMKAVELNPKQLMSKNGLENTDKIKALADVLGMKYSELVNKIKKNENSTFMYLARQLELEKADYIKKLKIEGISFKNEYRRFYPRTEEIAHLIGYTDIDGNGIEGVEKSFNDMLIGKDGERLVRKDARGRVVEHIADEKKYDAQNVMLSVDDRLQGYVYRELKKAVADNNADAGTAILVDIRTGEVLAMANAPSFNPNDRRDVTPEVMRNRAITDTFEPGSTVKPFVVLTALEKGTVGRNAVINTAPFKVNGKEITDVAPRPQQTLDEILVNSSNRGVSRLSLGMPISDLMNTYKGAGFGRPTDLGLIGEQAGLLNAERKRWSDLDRATISYGYGLTVTPLQLVRAYATLGSFGIYRPLSITKVDPPVIGQRVFSEKVSKEVVNILEKVAIHNKKAMVEGYRVGIKTGTAKKTAKGGGYAAKYLAYTVGIAPVSDPRYALVVMIDEPKSGAYYGGAVSAPVFSTIMSYALRTNGIAPDAENTVKASKSAKRIVYVNDHKNETVN